MVTMPNRKTKSTTSRSGAVDWKGMADLNAGLGALQVYGDPMEGLESHNDADNQDKEEVPPWLSRQVQIGVRASTLQRPQFIVVPAICAWQPVGEIADGI